MDDVYFYDVDSGIEHKNPLIRIVENAGTDNSRPFDFPMIQVTGKHTTEIMHIGAFIDGLENMFNDILINKYGAKDD